MKKSFLSLIIILVVSASPVSAANLSVYVSTSGNDTNSGTFAAPFKTIQRAQAWVRSQYGLGNNLTVYLRGGTYVQPTLLTFGATDGAAGLNTVVYTSYGTERAIISGGDAIPGSQFTVSGALHYAYLPGYSTRQLYTNADITDQPKPVRFPSSTYLTVIGDQTNPPVGETTEHGYIFQKNAQGAYVRAGDDGVDECADTLNAKTATNLGGKVLESVKILLTQPMTSENINTLNGSELVIQKAFSQSRLLVDSVIATGPLELTVYPTPLSKRLEGCNFDSQHEDGYRAHFERSYQFFANPTVFTPTPGSFVYSGSSLYFYGRAVDANLTGAAVLPRLEYLVLVSGAKNLTFSGIDFKHTRWAEPNGVGYIAGQAGKTGFCQGFATYGCTMPSMITIISPSKNVTIEKSRIYNAGAHGITIDNSVTDTVITKNRFGNIAGNAIVVGTFAQTASVATKNININNNLFQSVGKMYAGVAIHVGYTQNSLISHNSIMDVGYSGISVGWFGMENLPLSNTTIEYNNIGYTNILNGDGGGIYTLPGTKGDVIKDNYIHHMADVEWGFTSNTRHGIYLDEFTSNVTATNNQVSDVPHGLMIQNQITPVIVKAMNNSVTNLYIYNNNTCQVLPCAPVSSYDPSNNVQYVTGTVNQAIINASGAVLGW